MNPDLKKKYEEDEDFKIARLKMVHELMKQQRKVERIERKIKLWDSIHGLKMWDKK